MTTERKPDAEEPTVEVPEVQFDEEIQNVDPERTLVREDWNVSGVRRPMPKKN